MDIFRSHYYNTNYVWLRVLGLWPHEEASKKRLKRVTVVVLVVSLLIPQVIRLVEEWGKDIDIVIEVIGSILYFSGCQIKYISFLRVESKMKFLYEEIARHWKILSDPKEQQILRDYAQVGRFLSFGYLVLINIILVIYITLPLAPLVLDAIDPLNYTRPKAFPYFAEYFIDDQKYYFQLTVHGWIVCILSVQIYGTFDGTYTLCVQHACALFAITEYRLQEATKMNRNNEFSSVNEKDDVIYKETISAIHLHKQAIHFVSLIEECYTHVFFCIITINTTVVSLAAVDTMLNIEKGNIKQAIRIGMLYIGFLFHLFYNMRPGQNVVDSSTNIQDAVFQSDWFNVSRRTKQLLRIVMLRSTKPCTFTAKGLIVMDLESFAFVFKKSLSYVTVIGSVR